ncbi:MAG TPA: alkaline phosphatase D family protein [Mycobacteriales bacterium]|nr:alkaline phosphatase D family protein [Mycobacteriales bacterium]
MVPPLDRRAFLRTVAVTGAAGALGLPAAAASAAQPYDRALPPGWTFPVVADLLPFGHGVMSGDPLPDRVVLWTRITIPDARGWDATEVAAPQGISSVVVRWVVATDVALTDVVRRGAVTTSAARDWTVKVDADRLPTGTTLYYAFEALGYRSPVGRTRTAPAPDAVVTELTFAHVACSSWWQDVFNAYGRIADRDDLDLVTHAGDHVYETCGGHPASRYWAGQTDWANDLDNRNWATLGECRRRYALYYADPNLLRAHAAAPFAVMPDQHDDDDNEDSGFTAADARRVIHEWTPIRSPLPDGTGRMPPSPGPNVNLPVPTGDAAAYFYRSLPFGSIAEVVLLDVRRFADREGEQSQVLGDAQWAWLEGVLLASQGRTFRYVVNQVNLSQLRAFNLPFADAFERQFGIDTQAPQGEIYTTAWGGHPEERRRLLTFLRENGLVDNVVMSGDSHGWFGYDLVEDPQAPAYEPATGGGLLGAVGVELVPSALGRPGAQDVVAEELYFASVQGSRGAAYNDAERFDREFRTAALPATLGIEAAAQAANPNLLHFDWKANYGHAVVHLRVDRAVLEKWVSPQRVPSDDAVLAAQFSSPVGAPHLGAVLQPQPLAGSRQDAPASEARRCGDPAPAPAGPGSDRPAPVADARALPATGGLPVAAAGLALGAAGVLAAGGGRAGSEQRQG